ncbi:MAG: glutamyl-tRNA reductase [Nitrospirota bacterium]|nr:glutamyl-tRNA reductase [Nitrospirota bacterium]
MELIVVGLSHKTAPVEVRERLAFAGTALPEACRELTNGGAVAEAMVLSTCNRVEVYAVAGSAEAGFRDISRFLSRAAGDTGTEHLTPHLYHYPGNDAVQHMFSVASSLDSMVLGEPQILGQFKDAFEAALTAKSSGMVLNKVAKKAISVAKRVRTETAIAESAVSISYAAVELAKKVFEDIARERVMLLGAGEMAELALRNLVSAGVKEVTISTRTLENAQKLATEFSREDGVNARAVSFDAFPDEMVHSDIVICSTGASDYVLGRDMMARTIRARKHRPMFLIDISVPRNIDPRVNKVDDVYLYDIDDLQQVVDSNLKERQEEARKARRIVDDEVDTVARWMRSLDVVPTITALRGHAEGIAQAEAERVLGKLQNLSDKERDMIRGLAASIVNKLLHKPLTSLRREAQENDSQEMVEITRRLFALTDEPAPPAAEPANADNDPAPEPATRRAR